jgi:carbohydrate kinase (thermoresistant glucokinase family)
MGYAQSKLVTEHICANVARSNGIRTRVLRVGQVIADTVHGIWNATEAIPLIMQSGLTTGTIPRLDENPLWLPVDIVASAISEISLSTAGPAVLNIVNHSSFHWTRDLLPALHKAGLEFSESSQKEWVQLLRESNPDPRANPPIKLVNFFASKYDNDLSRIRLTYDTSYSQFLSTSLRSAPLLDQKLVDKFVQHFTSTSWAESSSPSTSVAKKDLIVVAGPCGSGKTTIASGLSTKRNIPWIEGDKLHSQASLAKMSRGVALSDSDRWVWLETLKATALIQMIHEKTEAVIITCSALKKSYRDELRQSRALRVTFLMLQGTEEVVKGRMSNRNGHYMGVEMVDSQFQDLEDPTIEETDVIPIDGTRGKDEVLEEVLSVLV